MTVKKMDEAATIKARARGAAKALKGLLAEKTLPENIRKAVEELQAALAKTWKDLEAETETTNESGANMGDAMCAMMHSSMVSSVDYRFGEGYITEEEYGGALGAVELCLATFRGALMADAPGMFKRRPFDYPEETLAASEAEEFMGDATALVESVVRRDGTIPVKIIQPGWGSSGYYPAEVLERDGPKVFTKGMHMYWNHPTQQEEAQRPERDLNSLAGVLTSDARWNPSGPAGAGLYADAKVMPFYADKVEALAPHIGLSIRAMGKAQAGEVEGKSGPIITELSAGRSVDYVTAAGAGGEIITMFEAAKYGADKKITTTGQGAGVEHKPIQEAEMGEKELQEANAGLQKQLDEAKAEAARMKEAALLREAGDQVNAALAKVSLHAATKARLVEGLVKVAPVKDGALDKEAFKTQIDEAVKAEVKYLSEAAGLGRISGMGASDEDQTEVIDAEEAEKSLVESFRILGLSEKGAKNAAQGRI